MSVLLCQIPAQPISLIRVALDTPFFHGPGVQFTHQPSIQAALTNALD